MSTVTPRIIFLTGMMISIFISILFYLQHPEINPDGLCYFTGAAEAWSSLSLKSVMHLCTQSKWPLYSILISNFDRSLHIGNLEWSAWIVNAIASACTWLFMMMILRNLGASLRAQIIGVILFLFFHDWLTARLYIVRDHGYWLFYFASIFFFCKTLAKTNLKNGLLFFASAMCAVLFRIEGALILGMLPLSIFFLKEWSWSRRWRCVVLFYVPIVIGIVFFLVWIMIFSIPVDVMGRIPELSHQVHSWWSASVAQYERGLNYYRDIFPYNDVHHFVSIWIAQLLTAYSIELVKAMTIFYTLIFIFGLRCIRRDMNNPVKTCLLFLIGLNFILNFLFFTEMLFTTNRYVMSLALMVLIFIPMILDRWMSSSSLLRNIAIVLFSLCVIQSALGLKSGLHRAQNHTLLYEGATFLRNSHISKEQVYANDSRVIFYAYFAPDHFRAFLESSHFSTLSSDLLSREQDKAILFYDRFGNPLSGTSSVLIHSLSEWKLSWKKQDESGRQVRFYSKN